MTWHGATLYILGGVLVWPQTLHTYNSLIDDMSKIMDQIPKERLQGYTAAEKQSWPFPDEVTLFDYFFASLLLCVSWPTLKCFLLFADVWSFHGPFWGQEEF